MPSRYPSGILGILFDTVNRTIYIPPDKLSEIVRVCQDWSDKRIVTKNELQSLLGLLLYISKCVKPARYFLNHMLQLLRDNCNKNSIVLTQEFFKDLSWFNTFHRSFNGVSFYDIRPLNTRIYLDASLQGLAGCYQNFVYSIPLTRGFNDCNIVQLEMLNVVVALTVWAAMWANRCIHIYCDNHAVVDVLTYGGTRDPLLSTCARNVWFLTAMFNISLFVSHLFDTLWLGFRPSTLASISACSTFSWPSWWSWTCPCIGSLPWIFWLLCSTYLTLVCLWIILLII